MVRAVTIRAKLIAAIALTVLGPVVTIGVALTAFGTLGDRFDDVERARAAQRLALDLKFAVTDMNGWQTAYGYDGGRSRRRFEAVRRARPRSCWRVRGRELTAPAERELLDGAERGVSTRSWSWTRTRGRRSRTAAKARPSGSCSARSSSYFERMARLADDLAERAGRRAALAAEGSSTRRATPRGASSSPSAIGAGVVIVLLLLTVQDVVRLALERRDRA